jgi:CHAD domain-containing protein
MVLFFALFQIGFTPPVFAAKAESYANDPACMVRFLKNIGPPNLGVVSIDELPEHILIQASKSRSNNALKLSTIAWQELNDLDKLSDIIEEIADGNLAVITPDLKKQLKSSRKYGSVLRDYYTLFDEKHQAPKSFSGLVNRFGKLNDALASESSSNIIESAKSLHNSLENSAHVEAISNFKPANRKEFAIYAKKTVEEIQKLSSEDSLNTDSYHLLRKQIRKLASYFLNNYAETANPSDQKIIDYLKSISEQMGETHDQIVEESLKGLSDYHQRQLTLPPELRARITQFLQRVELDKTK